MEKPADDKLPIPEKVEREPVFANELWFRDDQKDDVARTLTEGRSVTTVRAGDRTARTSDAKRGYRTGSTILIRFQREDGTFYPETSAAVVASAEKLRWGEVGTAREDLERYYGKKSKEDDVVTIITLEPIRQFP